MSYKLDSFLVQVSDTDRLLKIKNSSNVIVHTINGFSITSLRAINNIVQIITKSNIIELDFSTTNEARIALSRLQQHIDILKEQSPLFIDKEIENYFESVTVAESGGIPATTVELAIRFHWDENEEEVIQQITKNTTGISDFVVIRNSVGDFTIQSESTWVTALQVLVSVSGGLVIPRYALNNSTDIQILSADPQGNWMDDQIEYSVLVIKNIE